MNTKQKKTLLGGIVAMILVGSIIVVILAAMGQFSSIPNDEEAIKKVVKAIEDALVDLKKYKGGVFINVQEQWLDANRKETQKTEGDGKMTTVTLKKVTVYGVIDNDAVKTEDLKDVDAAKKDQALKDLVEAMDKKKGAVVIIGEEVEFTDGEVANEGKAKEDYSVFKRVLKDLGVRLSEKLVHGDGKLKDSQMMYHLVEVTIPPIVVSVGKKPDAHTEPGERKKMHVMASTFAEFLEELRSQIKHEFSPSDPYRIFGDNTVLDMTDLTDALRASYPHVRGVPEGDVYETFNPHWKTAGPVRAGEDMFKIEIM